MNNNAAKGQSSWILMVALLVSILLTTSFFAQNIRYRSKLTTVEEKIIQYTDQSSELETLRNEVETLKKQNQSLSSDLNAKNDSIKSIQDQLQKVNQQLQTAKSNIVAKSAPKATSKRRKK